MPYRQRLPVGTKAWTDSYNRRQGVENAIGALKGGFTNIARKFARVFRLVKVTMLFAFSVAGYNVECARSFRAKHPEPAVKQGRQQTRRRKRRRRTWTDILGPEHPRAGRSPPVP
jgi:hypothetical protein